MKFVHFRNMFMNTQCIKHVFIGTDFIKVTFTDGVYYDFSESEDGSGADGYVASEKNQFLQDLQSLF